MSHTSVISRRRLKRILGHLDAERVAATEGGDIERCVALDGLCDAVDFAIDMCAGNVCMYPTQDGGICGRRADRAFGAEHEFAGMLFCSQHIERVHGACTDWDKYDDLRAKFRG